MDINNINNSRDPIQILLTLLSKSEQILGLLNLPENIILKYNQLKELTFEKLNLEYKPLQKQPKSLFIKHDGGVNVNKQVNSSVEIKKIRMLNSKKTLIIEYMFDLIDRFKFEKNQSMNNYLIDNYAFQLPDKIRLIFVNNRANQSFLS